MKTWDVNELLKKYPIKIFGNGNLPQTTTLKKTLFQIKDDPWNRDFTTAKDTFTV